MLKVNEDNSIYVTRGDSGAFGVVTTFGDGDYEFQPGDVLRLKVFEKKNCDNVVLQKDFSVTEATTKVEISLEGYETRIGDTISKPTDYWYEIELNPFTKPQTIVGYDDDGAKIFKLFPEGRELDEYIPTEEEIGAVDDALNPSSPRPLSNRVITANITRLNALADENSRELEDVRGQIAFERARITNLATLAEGSTTGDAELIDARVGADGKTYSNLGESVRGQIVGVTNPLSKMDIYDLVLLDLKKKRGKINSEGVVTEDTSAQYIEVECESGDKFAISGRAGIYIELYVFADASGNVLEYFPRPSVQTDYTDLDVTAPYGATKLYVSSNNEFTHEIKKYVPRKICEELDEIKANCNTYGEIKDTFTNLFLHLGKIGGATVAGKVAAVTGPNGGFETNPFQASSARLMVHCKGSFSTPSVTFQYGYETSDGNKTYTHIEKITGNTFDKTFYIDCANLVEYEDAVAFTFIVNSIDPSYVGIITIEEIEIYDLNAFQSNELYNARFEKMMSNVFSAIDKNASDMQGISGGNTELKYAPNGNKYNLQVTAEGNVVAIPHIPTKVLFMGNSLLLGLDTNGNKGGAFGLAATSPYNDYAYQVQQAILEKNPRATFTKLHDAEFEMAETDGASGEYITKNNSIFADDLDLVIIQIGENVNTDTRKAVFTNNIGNLIEEIRTKSPKARVIFVCEWFNKTFMRETIAPIVFSRGCEYLSIAHLYVTENLGISGATITYYDGSTGTIQDAWVSHPGDLGMKNIASAIIEKLDM